MKGGLEVFLSQNLIIIANAISIVGLIFFFISSFMKKRRNVALAQIGCSGLNFIAWLLLGAYSAAVQDGISVLRNSVIVSKKQNKVLDIIFIVLALFLGVIFNVDGWLGVLPIFANFQYTIVLLKVNNIKYIKLSMCISCICWTIYSFVTLNYASAIFNAVTAVTTIIFIIKYIVEEKKTKGIELSTDVENEFNNSEDLQA
jgi:hypothetical protein